jgi:hypothetical protein
MSADLIIYCLQTLTDYPQFERLCSDVMNQSGFRDIEPLGGSSDRGRDALHVSRADPKDITIFAYSVRGDWQQKLFNEDCKRIREEKHVLHRLVFACTTSIPTTQNDVAKKQVWDEFGWTLELFDLERLRVRLTGDLRYLIARHPAIFCPPFFPTRGGLSISESRDTLIIDHFPADHALATWLARRLLVAGYRVWCYGTAPLAGESPDESVRLLIEKRAVRYLPILSSSSVTDADFLSRCAVASAVDGLVIPCLARAFDPSSLPTRLRTLAAASFVGGFAAGLGSLIACLDANAIRPTLDHEQGKAIALRSYMPQPVTQAVPERVYANTFPVTVPGGIRVCNLSQELSADEEAALQKDWAFSKVSPTQLLTFDDPPASLPLDESGRLPAYDWAYYESIRGKRSFDVVRELVRRSLDVACVRAGLAWCEDRKVHYFQHEAKPQWTVPFVHVDDRRTRVAVTGERGYGTGDNAVPFRYQLAPTFRVGIDADRKWWATLRLYVRITDQAGRPHEKKAINRRRKKVTKSWWNKEWFARILAVMQALADGKDYIVVGSHSWQVTIGTKPLYWDCPVSIDYRAVECAGDFQEEMADLRYVDGEGDESNDDQEEGAA